MTTITDSRHRGACLVGLATMMLVATGCSSTSCHIGAGAYSGAYAGLRMDAMLVTEDGGRELRVLGPIIGVLDFPFSAALDTVLLPWDLATGGTNHNQSVTNSVPR